MKLLLCVYFCLSFSFSFVSLAVSLNFLRERDAKDLPLLYAAISAPWAAKPALGAAVDRFPLDRSRFVCLGFVGGGLAWALAPLSVVFLILASGMVCIADCAADAIMVSVSKHNDQVQRFSIACRSAGELTGTLLGGLVYMGGYTLTMHCACLCLIPMGILSLDLEQTKPTCSFPKWTWSLVHMQIIGFCLSAIPSTSTYILMSWSAGGMTPITIALASTASQIGAFAGLWVGKFIQPDVSVWAFIVCRMLVVFSSWGIFLEPAGFAVFQNLMNGFGTALFLAPFVEKTTRLIPVDGNESFSYSAVMAALNLGGIASAALESLLMGWTGLESVENDPLPLVAVCLFLSILVFPFGFYFDSIKIPQTPVNGELS